MIHLIDSSRFSISSIILVLILFVSTNISCSADRSNDEKLDGRWSVVDALRNGRKTGTLQDAFFEFRADTLMTTNIFGEEQGYDFELTSGGFKQLGSPEIDYVIERLKGDTLVFSTVINRYNFHFTAVRDTVYAQ